MSPRKTVRTQFLIFTLYGDYIYPREGWAWTQSLLKVLDLLGVSHQATRSTLSRMSKHGWLRPRREGRQSLYALTDKGKRLLQQGTQRIFETRRLHWDGVWRIVVYSLPERKRHLREALRRRLSWLGYGPLAPGTWVSPHDRQRDVDVLLDELGARRYVQCFEGRRLGPLSDKEMVARCWDLASLKSEYRHFVQRWNPELRRYKGGSRGGRLLKPEECFVHRFWIIHDYGLFPSRDPNLPLELLPEGWLGDEAASVFREYRGLLTENANAFIESTLEGDTSPGWRRQN